MDTAVAVELARQTLLTALTMSAPLLAGVLAVALVLAVMQTVLNLQEQTLTVVPKIVLAIVMTMLLGPWMLQTLIDFTIPLFRDVLSRSP